jgi:hypothetical protein
LQPDQHGSERRSKIRLILAPTISTEAIDGIFARNSGGLGWIASGRHTETNSASGMVGVLKRFPKETVRIHLEHRKLKGINGKIAL